MREVKFRAFVEHVDSTGGSNNYSYMNYEVNFHGNINGIFATSGVKPLNPLHNKVTYMQYTGLKDKNGREIYEGDILAGAGYKNRPLKFKVLFEYGSYQLVEIGNKNNRDIMAMYAFQAFEVIGTVFENAELLAGDSN